MRRNSIGKRMTATLLALCCATTLFPTPVSLAAQDTEVEDPFYGHVEVPGELPPELVYTGPEANWGTTSIPAAYDSREHGNVTSVKDQNPFGSCWSFSTMAALESSVLSQGIYDEVDLSEFHLIHHNFNNVADPLGGISNDIVSFSNPLQ